MALVPMVATTVLVVFLVKTAPLGNTVKIVIKTVRPDVNIINAVS